MAEDDPLTLPSQPPKPSGRHPLFGALKDVTFVPSGVDLTEPADPDWGEAYEQPKRC